MIEALSSEFEILSEVGRGGMGVVYKARQISLDRIVAIKMLLREFARDDEFINRFKREAKAVASLNHQNIVDIYDIREAGGTWFIITEFVGGGTLRDLLKERKILPVSEASRIMYDACSALYYTHKKGIIHRDIKPDNVMFTDAREVKVTDFGLARLSDSSFQTRTGLSMGTPRYMSPEQASGKTTDHRSDIYSLGIMFFEMVTGKVPFEGDNAFAVVFKHINDPPPKPSEIKPDLPKWVDDVVLTCLAKDAKERHRDCSVFGQALEGSVSTPARVSWTRPVQDSDVPDATIQVTQPVGSQAAGEALVLEKKGKKTLLFAGIAVGVSILLVGALLLWKPSKDGTELPDQDVPVVASLIDAARKASGRGDWLGAAALWERVGEETAITDPTQSISAKKESATAWTAMGKAAEEQGNVHDAYRYYSLALDKDPQDAEIVASYTRLRVKMDEDLDIDGKIDLARGYLEDKQYAKALEELRRLEKEGVPGEKLSVLMAQASAGAQAKEVSTLLAEARALLGRSEFKDSRTKLDQALENDPQNVDARNLLDQLSRAEQAMESLDAEVQEIRQLMEARKIDEAVAACERLRSNHPDVVPVSRLLEELKERQSNMAQSQKLYASARQHMQQGRAEEAYSDLQDALVKDPDHKEASVLLKEVEKSVAKDAMHKKLRTQAKEALAKQDYATAISKAQELLGSVPGDNEAERILNQARQAQTDSQRASRLAEMKKEMDRLEQLLRLAKYEELAVQARDLASKAGSIGGEEATQIQEKATTLMKVASTVPSLISKAEAGLNKRDQPSVKGAIKACEEALKLNPSDPIASRFFSLATQQLADIEAELESAINQGKRAYELLDLEGAKRQFDRALSISPENEEAARYSREIDKAVDEITSRRIQGTTWFSQREYAKAKREFEAVLKILPGDLQAAEMMAKCDEALERADSASQTTTVESRVTTPEKTDPVKVDEKIDVVSEYIPLEPLREISGGTLQEPVDVYATLEAIYVVDVGLCQVVRYTLDGEFISAWGTKTKSLSPLGGDLAPGEFSRPTSIAVDRDENVYVLDSRGRCVQKFNKEGSFITKFGSRGSDRGGFDSPSGLTVGSDGSIFVVDSSQCRIQKFTSDGTFLASWGSKGSYTKELQSPSDICADWSGFLYITDTGNRRIQKYNLEGSYITAFPLKEITSGKHIPVGVGVDTQDNVYLTDSGSDLVQKFTRLNRFVSAWGKRGSQTGQLRNAQGIAVTEKGVVLVANAGNGRVERFAPAR